MEIELINIDDIVPYKNNAKRHPKKQVEQIKASIEEFGFNDPLAIDENNMLIEGHGRLEALKQLGYTQVECIRLPYMTEEQKKAYILVHNKLNMSTGFDVDVLSLELDDILNIDMENFGFNVDYDILQHEKNKDKPLEINNKFKIFEFEPEKADGFYEIPKLDPIDFKPTKLVGFNYAKTTKDFETGIHFYLDDYQYERLWNNPDNYMELLSKFECVLTPQFSVFPEMAKPVKIYNTFRGMLLGQMMQDYGINVIPTVYWGDESTYDYSFEGLPENSTLSIYMVNWFKNEKQNINALQELLKRKTPIRLLVYRTNKKDIKGVDFGDCEVVYYKNEIIKKLRD